MVTVIEPSRNPTTPDITNDPLYKNLRAVVQKFNAGHEIEWTKPHSLGLLKPKDFRAMKRTSPPDAERAARSAKRRRSRAARLQTLLSHGADSQS